MAIAAVLTRFFTRTEERTYEQAKAAQEKETVLRPFANEDIYFYVKRIDNSRVTRAADPDAGRAAVKTIGLVGAAVLLVIVVLVPSGYGVLAGYEIETLRKEASRLSAERAELELEEASLLSPARMKELARLQRFIDPAPEKVVYLGAETDTEFAAVPKATR
jgi:hypothetical protein